ncbi:MAG: ABC transporter ATP-binding protein [Desulfobacterium sp.]|nr:ABC transporter ATP-binding protein [Desulfobacterium sp.]
MEKNQPLLTVSNLTVSFKNKGRNVNAVNNLSLSMEKGEVLGLAGESGSGKTVTAMALAGLLADSKHTSVKGDIFFNGTPLPTIPNTNRFKSQRISMIFQDPLQSLNPAFTVGRQIQEVFMVRKKMTKRRARALSLDLLRQVKISSPESVAPQYPHQLSGGMCQRIMIAIALAGEPELLIADEPTTALDVTIQAQILQLLRQLHHTTKTPILLITHDLGIIAQFCHSLAIMLEGNIIEKGRVKDIFAGPLHPYTRGLLDSIPILGRKDRLKAMAPPRHSVNPVRGCSFHGRCPRKKKICEVKQPELREQEPGHFVRCFTPGGLS